MNLLEALAAERSDPRTVRGRIGTVVSVGTKVANVDFGDGNVVSGIPTSRLYSPSVGDVVLVILLGSAWLVLCPLG